MNELCLAGRSPRSICHLCCSGPRSVFSGLPRRPHIPILRPLRLPSNSPRHSAANAGRWRRKAESRFFDQFRPNSGGFDQFRPKNMRGARLRQQQLRRGKPGEVGIDESMVNRAGSRPVKASQASRSGRAPNAPARSECLRGSRPARESTCSRFIGVRSLSEFGVELYLAAGRSPRSICHLYCSGPRSLFSGLPRRPKIAVLRLLREE